MCTCLDGRWFDFVCDLFYEPWILSFQVYFGHKANRLYWYHRSILTRIQLSLRERIVDLQARVLKADESDLAIQRLKSCEKVVSHLISFEIVGFLQDLLPSWLIALLVSWRLTTKSNRLLHLGCERTHSCSARWSHWLVLLSPLAYLMWDPGRDMFRKIFDKNMLPRMSSGVAALAVSPNPYHKSGSSCQWWNFFLRNFRFYWG